MTTTVFICVVFMIHLSQVWRLQAALGEQTEITKYSQQEFERLQNVIFSSLTTSLTTMRNDVNL
jgi:hypothetical protein